MMYTSTGSENSLFLGRRVLIKKLNIDCEFVHQLLSLFSLSAAINVRRSTRPVAQHAAQQQHACSDFL